MAVATFNSFNATPGGKGNGIIWFIIAAIAAAAILGFIYVRNKAKREKEEELLKRLEE